MNTYTSPKDQPNPTPGKGDVIRDLISALRKEEEDTVRFWPGPLFDSNLAKVFDLLLEASQLLAESIGTTLEEELIDRHATGLKRYGTVLQYGNGRKAEHDLMQELADGLVYCWQKRGEVSDKLTGRG